MPDVEVLRDRLSEERLRMDDRLWACTGGAIVLLPCNATVIDWNKLARSTRFMHTLDCIGAVYRMCISVRDRDGRRYRGTAHSSALGEECVGVIDCGPSLGDYS